MLSQINFDMTLTIGAIIQIALLVFGIVGGWFKLRQEIAILDQEMKRVEKMVTDFRSSCAACHFTEFSARHAEIIIQHDARLKTLETLVPSIHQQTAKLIVIAEWLERIETKLNR